MDEKPTLDRMESAMSDAAITTKIKGKFILDNLLKSFNVHVKTENGVVTLSGDLEDEEDIEYAVKLVSEVDGVKEIKYIR